MDILMQNQNLIVALLVVVTVVAYSRHRQNLDSYSESGYANISPLKHDMLKQTTLDLVPLLIYGINADGPFYNPNNILGSKVGTILVTLFAYAVYYHLVEPYVGARIPKW